MPCYTSDQTYEQIQFVLRWLRTNVDNRDFEELAKNNRRAVGEIDKDLRPCK